MRGLVYIAGPYAAPTPEERAENVRRIGVLSRLALGLGLTPVTVHAAIDAGHFGQDSNPVDRKRGLDAACTLAQWVAKSGGDLWVLTRDDGFFSSGCVQEVDAFQRTANAGPIVSRTWAEWCEIIDSVRPQ